KGSGADTTCTVPAPPSAGIDPQELLDTRPYARAWHHHILNDRSLYGLPRKFNVGFDGGGMVPVLADTNDIAFTAVRAVAGSPAAPAVYFRLRLGGLPGPREFPRPPGVVRMPQGAGSAGAAHAAGFLG